jgi:AsmA protein
VRISAAELKIGDARFTPAAIDATLASGVLKAQVSNLGAYDGNANGDLTVDVSAANPTYTMRADLAGVRALPLMQGLADFDRIDGKMQAKVSVRSAGTSQRAIMSNMAGTAFVVFQDGAIKGLNVAQMIRSLTASTLSGWQESDEKATDLSQLSASFKIDKGQAQTTDLNLVGPLVKMTGAGTIDLGTKQIGFRVEPKLVMTTEGQGRASDPVGLGIPVMISGPWGSPRIYPEMQGILDNPDGAYAKLKEMGKGLFGEKGAGIGAAIGNLLGGQQGGASAQQGGTGGQAGAQPGGPLGGQLGGTIGNLLQQGLGGLGQSQGQGGGRPSGQRSIPSRTSPAEAPTQVTPAEDVPAAEPAPPAPPSETAAQQDSQPMNDVLRQLFNR